MAAFDLGVFDRDRVSDRELENVNHRNRDREITENVIVTAIVNSITISTIMKF